MTALLGPTPRDRIAAASLTARGLKVTARTFSADLDLSFSTSPDRHRPPGALRRTATAAAVGALALAGAVALPAAPARADTTAKGDVIADLWE